MRSATPLIPIQIGFHGNRDLEIASPWTGDHNEGGGGLAVMALSGGSGTMESVAAEYFNWEPDGSPVSIHMHLDAVDGIARDVIEGLKTLPRRGLEVGGLLLGH